MATISTADPQLRSALDSCIATLRRLAEYELDPALEERLQDLGERKEFLEPSEHQELMALVALAQQRTRDKLEAAVALERLQEVFPDLQELS
jgi:hypothetical protein